jgi:hypothetical protein
MHAAIMQPTRLPTILENLILVSSVTIDPSKQKKNAAKLKRFWILRQNAAPGRWPLVPEQSIRAVPSEAPKDWRCGLDEGAVGNRPAIHSAFPSKANERQR